MSQRCQGWHSETNADCKVVALRNSVGHPGNVGLGYFRHRAFDLWSERDHCGVNLGIYPLMLIYTAVSYRVFKGKARATPLH